MRSPALQRTLEKLKADRQCSLYELCQEVEESEDAEGQPATRKKALRITRVYTVELIDSARCTNSVRKLKSQKMRKDNLQHERRLFALLVSIR